MKKLILLAALFIASACSNLEYEAGAYNGFLIGCFQRTLYNVPYKSPEYFIQKANCEEKALMHVNFIKCSNAHKECRK